MYKQRMVKFFIKEVAEEFAQKVNGICIPKFDFIDGKVYEWFEVWYVYYYDPRWQETWKDYLQFALLMIAVIIGTFILGCILVAVCPC